MLDIKFLDLQKQRITIQKNLDGNIKKVLEHAKFIMGPEVKYLEEKLKIFSGTNHAITCASGTDALILSMLSLNIGKGDIVFCPSFTFPATAEAILLIGAIPVFIDVSKDTFNICYKGLIKEIEKSLKNKHKPKAIVAVDLFGLPANYRRLNEIAKKYRLSLISDAAQSYGASYYSKKVGSLSLLTCTSFFPAKPLGCYGDGGAIFTDSKEIKEKIESLRAHGKGREKYQIVDIGLNSRLDTIQAAILLAKLKIFEWENIERNRLAKVYTAQITDNLKKPLVPTNTDSVWAQYTLVSSKREKIIGFLSENNIPTMIYYPIPMHRQPAYEKYFLQQSTINLKNSDFLAKQVFSIPIHAYLSELEQEYIIEKINEAERKF